MFGACATDVDSLRAAPSVSGSGTGAGTGSGAEDAGRDEDGAVGTTAAAGAGAVAGSAPSGLATGTGSSVGCGTDDSTAGGRAFDVSNRMGAGAGRTGRRWSSSASRRSAAACVRSEPAD